MCVGPFKPKQSAPPKQPARVPEAAATPAVEPSTPAGRRNTDEIRRRRAGGVGTGTILTGARGVQNGGTTATKTLLGE